MFPSLKLFHRIPCPDQRPPQSNCLRSLYCPFNHDKATTATRSEEDKAQRDNVVIKTANQTIHRTSQTISNNTNTKATPITTAKEKRETATGESTQTERIKTKTNEKPTQTVNLLPPRIQINKCSSVHTFPSTRQKLLESIYEEFVNLYRLELQLSEEIAKTLAHRDSLKEEVECLQRSNRSTYRNTVISSIVKIRKRRRDAEKDLQLVRSRFSSTTPQNLDQPVQNNLTGSNSEYDQSHSKLVHPPCATDQPKDEKGDKDQDHHLEKEL